MLTFTPPSSLLPGLSSLAPALLDAHTRLQNKTGPGAEYTGWITLPSDYDKKEFARVQKAAQKIRSDSEVLLVAGIGGSYLGARAVIEYLNSSFYNLLAPLPSSPALFSKEGGAPQILFLGNSLSGAYLQNIIKLIETRSVSVNVISKSGTTTETAVAFRILKTLMEEKYGKEEAAARIYATTDKSKGTLRALAGEMGYETFVVPDDIGGRYSVLTSVGLLPVAAAGIDITALMEGARDMMTLCKTDATLENPCFAYAAARHILYKEGKKIEVLASYDPDFVFMAEWWKQLYGESEGKEGKGVFPAAVSFTADLHSMGQYLQEGERTLFETVVASAEDPDSPKVPPDPRNMDGLNFLSGKTLDEINTAARQGTCLAHTDGGLPVMTISTGRKSARALGELIYFFEYACALSVYMLGVNPFNQPGVESYKKNMFALLGKPGYEKEGDALRKRL